MKQVKKVRSRPRRAGPPSSPPMSPRREPDATKPPPRDLIRSGRWLACAPRPALDQIMGPSDIERLVEMDGIGLDRETKVWTVGRNGQKKEVSEEYVIEKYLERKAANGEFIETMKVTSAHRRGGRAC